MSRVPVNRAPVFGHPGSSFFQAVTIWHTHNHHWLLVTSPRATFMISGWNAICPFMHLSAFRGYFLTGHRAGGEIVLFMCQVHRTIDRSWKCFLVPVAQGSPDLTTLSKIVRIVKIHLACDLRCTYLAAWGWQVILIISQISGGRRICWSWATVTLWPLQLVLGAKNPLSTERSPVK